MSVDFSAIIQNFLTAELGEDVRQSLVEIARALQTAINSQLNTVTDDLTDTDPNAAALASAVGELFAETLSRLEQNINFSDEIISGDFLKPEWIPHSYVSNVDGSVNYTSQNYSVTKNLIRVPYGSTLVIHSYASGQGSTRIVTYDEDENFIAYEDHISPFDFSAHYTDAAFVRVQYASTNVDTINSACIIRVEYADGAVTHQSGVYAKLDDAVYGSVSGSGNPIILKNTSNDIFKSIALSLEDASTKLNICGKNLFTIRDYANILRNYNDGFGIIEKNGVKFVFVPSSGMIRVFSETGATAGTTSASDALGNKYATINGTNFYHNFKFKFPVDTIVSISDNTIDGNDYYPPASSGREAVLTPVHLPFNTGVQMRVYAGETVEVDGQHRAVDGAAYRVINGGLSFTAKAGKEYGIYIVVQKGWIGDIVFQPQVEIGSHTTAYEKYTGYELTDLDSSQPADENLFSIPAADSSVMYADKDANGVRDLTAIFDSKVDEIYISSKKTKAPGSTVIAPTTHNTPEGEATYIVKFSGDGGYVLVSGIPRTVDRAVVAQIFPVNNNDLSSLAGVSYDYGDGAYILTKPNTQYKYRILVRNDTEFEGSIRPVIARGRSALAIARGFPGTTTLYTDDSASISVTAAQMRNGESIANSAKIADRINVLTGGRILDDPEKRRPMISFIDDDTTNYELVEEYHTVCSTAGLNDTPILGGFAVETQHLENSARLLSDLLDYEKEGFACLYHCLEQNDNTWYWVDNPDQCENTKPAGAAAYNETSARNNFVEGLLKMREFGFINPNYWVSPYGVNNEFMQSLAKQYGMKCLVSYQSQITEFDAYVSRYGNVGTWDIPRFHYNYDTNYIEGAEDWPYSYKELKLKNIIDATVADKGWLIVTTHVNTWPEDTAARNAMKYRFKKVVRYAQTAGVEVVPFPVGFETFKPYLDMHDLLK